MLAPAIGGPVLRFSVFEVDLRTGELRKHGVRIKIQDQPFNILAMLLEHPGELVTREQIQQALWPANTFVDFEHSVNTAVRRLRDVLNDDAESPRFIETLPRRGYRFLADVRAAEEPKATTAIAGTLPSNTEGRLRWIAKVWPIALTVLFTIVLLSGWRLWPRSAVDSVAVLPFTNEANDANLDHLAIGLPGRVLDTLSEIPALRVASRNSAFTFRGPSIKTGEVANALHVRAVLLGTIRKNGNLLQVTAELIDTKDDKHLWGAEYAASSEQLATMGTTIAREVAARLHQSFAPDFESRMRRSTPNPVAYEAYLRGEYVMDSRANGNLRMALNYFQKAIDADPKFAPAYASLGKAYGLLGWYGGMPADEAQQMAEAAADRALELDPNVALAWMVKAACLQNYHYDWQAADRAGRKALELSPNSAEINRYYAVGLRRRGRMDEAIAAAERAEVLDPLWIGETENRLETYYYARRLDEALRMREERTALREDSCSRVLFGRIYATAGRTSEATNEVSTLRVEGLPPEDVCGIAQVYAMAGDSAKARSVLAAGLKTQGEQGPAAARRCSPYDAAAVYAVLGDRSNMLQSLQKADQELDPKRLDIFIDPAFDHYRSDPAYLEITTRLTTPR